MKLSLNYNTNDAEGILESVVNGLPGGVNAYLVGGSLRNALFRHYHGEVLRQRDYDVVVTKGFEEFLAYLLDSGFHDEGKIKKPTQVVMLKPAKDDYDPENLNDYIALDVHRVDGLTIEENLQDNVGLLINGSAINLRNLFDEDWQQNLIALDNTQDCIKQKRILINPEGYTSDPRSFFSCLRFMSVGFSPPPKDEVALLLNELKNIQNFDRNVNKVIDYVGGAVEARRLVASLGIAEDVFDKKVISNL